MIGDAPPVTASPLVNLTSPQDSANFVLGATINLTAVAAPSTGSALVTNLQFLANGIPVTLSDSGDRSLLGTGSNGPGGAVDRPNCALGGDLQLAANDPRTRLPYFNAGIFSRETIGYLGTCQTRFFHGPGINNWDTALLRDMRLTEKKIIQFRFEFFNAFNHTQFNNPSGSVTNANFGKVTSARSPRIAQVALKFLF